LFYGIIWGENGLEKILKLFPTFIAIGRQFRNLVFTFILELTGFDRPCAGLTHLVKPA
jgi:hypothetical protein